MEIKVNEVPVKSKKTQFPVLLKSRVNDAVWLFVSMDEGVCVASGNSVNIEGDFRDGLIDADDTSRWEPFSGSVTFSNN